MYLSLSDGFHFGLWMHIPADFVALLSLFQNLYFKKKQVEVVLRHFYLGVDLKD